MKTAFFPLRFVMILETLCCGTRRVNCTCPTHVLNIILPEANKSFFHCTTPILCFKSSYSMWLLASFVWIISCHLSDSVENQVLTQAINKPSFSMSFTCSPLFFVYVSDMSLYPTVARHCASPLCVSLWPFTGDLDACRKLTQAWGEITPCGDNRARICAQNILSMCWRQSFMQKGTIIEELIWGKIGQTASYHTWA